MSLKLKSLFFFETEFYYAALAGLEITTYMK